MPHICALPLRFSRRLARFVASALLLTATAARAGDRQPAGATRSRPPGLTPAVVQPASRPLRIEIAARAGFEELSFAPDVFQPLVNVVPATLEVDVGTHRDRLSAGGYVTLIGGMANEPYGPARSSPMAGIGFGFFSAIRGRTVPLFARSEFGGVIQGLRDYQVRGVDLRVDAGVHLKVGRGHALELAAGLDMGVGSGLWAAWSVSLGLVYDTPDRRR